MQFDADQMDDEVGKVIQTIESWRKEGPKDKEKDSGIRREDEEAQWACKAQWVWLIGGGEASESEKGGDSLMRNEDRETELNSKL